MGYVDALKIKDTIHVAERDQNGRRLLQKFPAKYTMYAKHPSGDYTSLYGDPLIRYDYATYKEFIKEVRSARPGSLFEHDVNPVFRFLEDNDGKQGIMCFTLYDNRSDKYLDGDYWFRFFGLKPTKYKIDKR